MAKPKKPNPAASFRDRIKELRRVPASALTAHPRNWRRHPDGQRTALAGVLKEIGFADAVLARETEDGLMIIDGHLRVSMAQPDDLIPTLILDVSEADADKLLATLDPLASLAERDAETFLDLTSAMEVEDERMAALMEQLNAEARAEVEPEDQPKDKARAMPNMVIRYELIFDTEEQQERFYKFLRLLQTRHPGDTIAARIDAFFDTLEWMEED